MNSKHSSRHEIKAWLFDAYPSPEGMVVWLITEEDERLKLVDIFHPSFYFDGPSGDMAKIFRLFSKEPTPITAKRVERIEFFRGKHIPVVQVTLKDPTQYAAIVKKLTRLDGRFNLYNCDIGLPQQYFYER